MLGATLQQRCKPNRRSNPTISFQHAEQPSLYLITPWQTHLPYRRSPVTLTAPLTALTTGRQDRAVHQAAGASGHLAGSQRDLFPTAVPLSLLQSPVGNRRIQLLPV